MRRVQKNPCKGQIVLDDQEDRVARLNQIAIVIKLEMSLHDFSRGGGKGKNHVDLTVVQRIRAVCRQRRLPLPGSRNCSGYFGPDGEIRLGQVERECAAGAGSALQTDLTTKQSRQ